MDEARRAPTSPPHPRHTYLPWTSISQQLVRIVIMKVELPVVRREMCNPCNPLFSSPLNDSYLTGCYRK